MTAPGIDPGTFRSTDERLTTCATQASLEYGIHLVKVIYICSNRFAIAMHAPKGILSRLAFFNNYYWKIASLWLAIFSGSPGNFST